MDTSHADAIKAAAHVSTGTIFATTLKSQSKVLKKPDIAPAMTPVGPYMLSIHPGNGSL